MTEDNNPTTSNANNPQYENIAKPKRAKKITTITVPNATYEKARQYRISLSRAAQLGIRDAIARFESGDSVESREERVKNMSNSRVALRLSLHPSGAQESSASTNDEAPIIPGVLTDTAQTSNDDGGLLSNVDFHEE